MTIRSPNTAVLSLGHRSRQGGHLTGLAEARAADVPWRRPVRPRVTIITVPYGGYHGSITASSEAGSFK